MTDNEANLIASTALDLWAGGDYYFDPKENVWYPTSAGDPESDRDGWDSVPHTIYVLAVQYHEDLMIQDLMTAIKGRYTTS